MKKLRWVIVVIIMLIIWEYKFPMYSQANQKVDMFSEIINKTGTQVMEYGVQVNFSTQNSGEEACKSILMKLNYDKSTKINIEENGGNYYMEFSSPEVEGYIQSINSDNDNIISINIKEYSDENKLTELKEKIKNSIECEKEVVFFQYVKGKTINSNMKELNKQVIGILKSFDTKEIKTIEINNGLSTTAHTHQYNELNVGGRFVDFNYALCSYDTGDYIILATPVIPITY
ncbi:YwmB family TATA-box binding protein [Clostridium sp. BSD9I1]|uniref:YwmB family TATA-box binding protein n=1 Tax=Clostridium sp. BSD9I1 TaxID=2003589 RepID=UPI0016445D89|nr:YwmB family TATA-box binding protein [Clostridium sp. BSD9I1]